MLTVITQSKVFHTLLSGKSSESLGSLLLIPSLVQFCGLGCVTSPFPGCFHLAYLIVTLLQFIRTANSANPRTLNRTGGDVGWRDAFKVPMGQACW